MLVVRIVVGVVAVLALIAVLWEVFETIVLPHRVSRRLRLTRLHFRTLWGVWAACGARIRSSYQLRENVLAVFGPLSLLLLLVLWATLVIVCFAGIQWALGSPLVGPQRPPTFGTDLYYSGTTFFTLGLGDVTPRTTGARVVTVVEVGTGFGLLAMVIGYLPVLYQAFSRREVGISLLDAHAGSPPTAAEFLRRHRPSQSARVLLRELDQWERWAAELLESLLSYPSLAYFRSQHDNQSWVAALALMLDSCALLQVCAGVSAEMLEQAHYTYAIARHVTVDLTIYLHVQKSAFDDRLPATDLVELRALLMSVGLTLDDQALGDLNRLRRKYEPYVSGLAALLLMPLPGWVADEERLDDWQSEA